jgi:hypothetical protein
VHRYITLVHTILLVLRSSVLRKEVDFNKRGKILKPLCSEKAKNSEFFLLER